MIPLDGGDYFGQTFVRCNLATKFNILAAKHGITKIYERKAQQTKVVGSYLSTLWSYVTKKECIIGLAANSFKTSPYEVVRS